MCVLVSGEGEDVRVLVTREGDVEDVCVVVSGEGEGEFKGVLVSGEGDMVERLGYDILEDSFISKFGLGKGATVIRCVVRDVVLLVVGGVCPSEQKIEEEDHGDSSAFITAVVVGDGDLIDCEIEGCRIGNRPIENNGELDERDRSIFAVTIS